MKPKRGTAWINLGLLLLAAALFLAAFNRRESYEAQQISMVVMEKMSEALAQTEASEPTALRETVENQNSNPARVDDSNVHLLDRRDPARVLPRKRKRWAGVYPAHLIIAV